MTEATSPGEVVERLEMRAQFQQSVLEKHGAEQHPLILTQNAINLDRAAASLIRELTEALKPFAADAVHWSASPDGMSLVESAPGYSDALTVGDLRRAAKLVEPQ